MHDNRKDNSKPHFLYVIFDCLLRNVYKYGISSSRLREDGTSPYLDGQVNQANQIAADEQKNRFKGKILIYNIPGRVLALVIEAIHIRLYKIRTGKLPRGNKDFRFFKKKKKDK